MTKERSHKKQRTFHRNVPKKSKEHPRGTFLKKCKNVSWLKKTHIFTRFHDPNAPGHKGLDLAIPINTEVRATHDGVVVKADYNPLYGNLVVVQNSFYSTWYAHNAYLLVRQGDEVHCGDLLALSGSTGKSTGPHLHYEVHDNQDTPLNPEDYLGEDSEVLKFRGCNPGGEK